MYDCDGIEVDGSCKDASLLMVGMIASDLGSSGCGVDLYVEIFTEKLLKLIDCLFVSFSLSFIRIAVNRSKQRNLFIILKL